MILSERIDRLALTLKGKDAAEFNGTVRELIDLVEKTHTEKPCAEDVGALEKMLEENPSLWFLAFDLANHVEDKVLQQMVPANPARPSLKIRLKELRRELGYEEVPALERLLIEQVALCWLQHNLVEMRHAIAMNKSITLDQGMYWDRKLAASQRRYLRACETLARVRKLTGATVQVNIGERQINLAGDLSISRKGEPGDVREVAQELPEEG